MNRTPNSKLLSWSDLAGLAMLGVLVVLGLAAAGLSLLQSLAALGFGAGVLLLAWLWQLTFRRAETAPPPTRRQRAWNAAVFVAWLAVMAALLVWWWMADVDERASDTTSPGEKPGAAEPPLRIGSPHSRHNRT